MGREDGGTRAAHEVGSNVGRLRPKQQSRAGTCAAVGVAVKARRARSTAAAAALAREVGRQDHPVHSTSQRRGAGR